MGSIFVLNRMYSDVYVAIVGPDGGIGRLRLGGGSPGTFTNCPPWEFAIAAFSTSDGSLQHLGKVRPGLAVYELTPNQGAGNAPREFRAAEGPSAAYEQHT